ncbi:MAG: T9SS type A sorting domain-containing protein, partial [Bacteroidia bacterium]|nr:T9SS type A sorting domain-containing protein [Bacteroidia bacterium]
RDSLFIGGGFWSVDGDSSISRIAKWIGGDYVEECGNTTGNLPQPEKVELLVYPNPANDLLNIELPQNSGDLFLEIFSVTGQRLLNARLYSSSQEIRISHLPPGLYLAKLTNKNGISSTQRIVIAR